MVKQARYPNGTRRCPSVVIGEPISQVVFDIIRERVQHATLVWGDCFALLFPCGSMMLTRRLPGSAKYLVGCYPRHFHSTDLRDDISAAMNDLRKPDSETDAESTT